MITTSGNGLSIMTATEIHQIAFHPQRGWKFPKIEANGNFSNAKFVSFLFQGSYLDEKRPGCFKLFNVGTSHFHEPQSCALA